MLIENGIPRRRNTLRWIPAEQSVSNLIREVESLGCDERLTEIVVRLSELQDRLADWAESTGNIAPIIEDAHAV